MIWTDEQVARAKTALSQSGTTAEAAALMSLSGPEVSPGAICAAFLKRGLRARDFLHPTKAQASAVAAARSAANQRYGLARPAVTPLDAPADGRPDGPTVGDLRRAMARGNQSIDAVARALSMGRTDAQRLINEAVSAGCPLVMDGDAIRDRDKEPPAPPEVHRVAGQDEEWTGVALISDTHVGSEKAAGKELRQFLEYAYARGVRHVVHAGDLLDGWYGHRSAQLEQTSIGVDRQVSAALLAFPEMSGLNYWILGGNHDGNFWRQAGIDPVLAAIHRAHAAGRQDMHHLGTTVGRLAIGTGDQEIRIEAAHTEKGAGAYARSYPAEKYVEGMTGGSKPHILIMGHLHRYFTAWIRGVWVCMPGCFQWQTEFERRKCLEPSVGGVISWVRRSPYAITVAHEWHGHHAREVEWIHAAS